MVKNQITIIKKNIDIKRKIRTVVNSKNYLKKLHLFFFKKAPLVHSKFTFSNKVIIISSFVAVNVTVSYFKIIKKVSGNSIWNALINKS